jgi:CO/xanthine dehydrogenase FAD-binding subunit
MDLPFVEAVITPRGRDELPPWSAGMAAIGGGTWLFSEPQHDLSVLVDLASMRWDPLAVDEAGLHIAATCTIAQLARFVAPPEWRAAALIQPCCEALLGSFKVWNAATVGGNICLALPAGPMTALAAGLGGVATIWLPGGGERLLPVVDLVVGDHLTSLAPGEIVREILLPIEALRQRAAFRRISLTPLGRSGALLIGVRLAGGGFALTLTAATTRPVRLEFAGAPSPGEVAARIEDAVTGPGLWHDDMHGEPAWRRHVSLMFAEEIRGELMEG